MRGAIWELMVTNADWLAPIALTALFCLGLASRGCT